MAYPILIAGMFFFFLWQKPIHLYTPQSLSSKLQKAFVPDDKALAPALAADRAKVEAIASRLKDLEVQLLDVAQRMQPDLDGVLEAAKSDFEADGAEIHARAKAAGDESREGIAKAGREIEIEKADVLRARVDKANVQISSFKSWLVDELGLKKPPAAPRITLNESRNGPYFYANGTIEPGQPKMDYFLPGIYINAVKLDRGLRHIKKDETEHLCWVMADYMSSRSRQASVSG